MPSYRFLHLSSAIPPQLKSLANEISPLLFKKFDNAIHRKNPYAEYSAVCFVDNYSLNSDLSDSVIQPSNNWGLIGITNNVIKI